MNRYSCENKVGFGVLGDLAVERRRADTDLEDVEYQKEVCESGIWECVKVKGRKGEESIGRPIGNYHTLNLGEMDLLTESEIADAADDISRKLCELFDENGIIPERILVVGLGNRNLTSDSVGPKAARIVRPTLHIMQHAPEVFDSLDCSAIAVLCPDVTPHSGLESADTVLALAKKINPDALIVIDSIAARSTERLGTTVQISDTGISPGSGIGNTKKAICEDTVFCPVIAIGVPTVIDARVFCENATYGKDNSPLWVSPKEIDGITNVAAKIIGEAINQAFGISPFW